MGTGASTPEEAHCSICMTRLPETIADNDVNSSPNRAMHIHRCPRCHASVYPKEKRSPPRRASLQSFFETKSAPVTRPANGTYPSETRSRQFLQRVYIAPFQESLSNVDEKEITADLLIDTLLRPFFKAHRNIPFQSGTQIIVKDVQFKIYACYPPQGLVNETTQLYMYDDNAQNAETLLRFHHRTLRRVHILPTAASYAKKKPVDPSSSPIDASSTTGVPVAAPAAPTEDLNHLMETHLKPFLKKQDRFLLDSAIPGGVSTAASSAHQQNNAPIASNYHSSSKPLQSAATTNNTTLSSDGFMDTESSSPLGVVSSTSDQFKRPLLHQNDDKPPPYSSLNTQNEQKSNPAPNHSLITPSVHTNNSSPEHRARTSSSGSSSRPNPAIRLNKPAATSAISHGSQMPPPSAHSNQRHLFEGELFHSHGLQFRVMKLEPRDGHVASDTTVFLEGVPVPDVERIKLLPIGASIPNRDKNLSVKELRVKYLDPYFKGRSHYLDNEREMDIFGVSFAVLECEPKSGLVTCSTIIDNNGPPMSVDEVRSRQEEFDMEFARQLQAQEDAAPPPQFMVQLGNRRVLFAPPSGAQPANAARRGGSLSNRTDIQQLFQSLQQRSEQARRGDGPVDAEPFPSAPALLQLLQQINVQMQEQQGGGGGGGGGPNRGLSNDTIDRLPMWEHKVTHDSTTKSEEDGNEMHSCRICLEGYTDGEMLRALPCFHRYHKECIDRWLAMNRKCPICKTDVVRSFQSHS